MNKFKKLFAVLPDSIELFNGPRFTYHSLKQLTAILKFIPGCYDPTMVRTILREVLAASLRTSIIYSCSRFQSAKGSRQRISQESISFLCQ